MKKKLPAYLVLLVITLIAGMVLGGTDLITKQPIQEQARLAAENARKLALPEADAFYQVRTAEADGFAGPVHVTVYLTEEGAIEQLIIGDSRFSETPGYGAGAKEPAFADQFVGKTAPVALEEIDAVSGATITTKAVVQAVNSACSADTGMDWCYVGLKDGQPVGYVAQTTVQGFGGPVEIIAGLNNELVLTGITVGGSNFSETAGLGAKAKEPGFTNQFAGKKGLDAEGKGLQVVKAGQPKGDNTIDAITAATITSRNVTGGVNEISAHVDGIIHPESQKKALVMVKPDITYTASSKGYGGPVQVELGVDEQGKINYLSIGGDKFAETNGIGSKVKESSFIDQFVGMQPPVSMDEVDAVSGATISSAASVDAINKAYNKYLEANGQAGAGTPPQETQAPSQDAPVTGNVFTASAKGYGGPVQVEVTFDAEGKITSLSIGGDKFAETEGLGSKAKDPAFAQQFIGKQAPVALADIDVLSGATVTTEAVLSAIEKAYNKAQPAAPADVPAASETVTDTPVTGNVFTASAKGYGGPVQVEVTFDAEGKITSLSIGGDKFAETEGLGSRVKEYTFTQQFIGKQAPVALEDIDAISGATVTTEAVLSAIEKAYNKAIGQ